MFEVVFSKKSLFKGQMIQTDHKEVTPIQHEIGTVLEDGRMVVSVRRLAVIKAKKVTVPLTKVADPTALLVQPFEGAWGRSKWKGVCEMHTEALFDKLRFDQTLQHAGCKTPTRYERWKDFREVIQSSTLNNKLIKEKLDLLESRFVIKNYFLPHKR